MKLQVLIILFVVCCLQNSDSACTFPSNLVGSWEASSLGSITFTSSQVSIPDVDTYGTVTFDCDTLDGTKYLLRSTTSFVVLGTSIEILTCFDSINEITTSSKYTLKQATVELANANDWRIKLQAVGTVLTAASLCDESTPYPIETYDVLIKSGSVADVKIQCPDALLGTFTYTFDSGSGNECVNGSYATGCSDLTKITFDLSVCSTAVAYSASGDLYCVNQTLSNGIVYVKLYNTDVSPDGSTTFRYTCMAITTSGSNVYVTQYPDTCLSGQISTSVNSPGASLVMTSNVPVTPKTPPKDLTVIIVVSVVVVLFVLAAVAAVVTYVVLKKSRIEKRNGAVSPAPDSKSVGPSIGPNI